MDQEVVVTETVVDVNLKDQFVVTILGAVAGMLASKAVEKGYFAGKARYQLRKSR